MRTFVFLAALSLSGCAFYTVNPGHRGLRFDPHEGGLHQQVLQPGIYNLGWCFLRDCGQVDDYDVTYSTHRDLVHTVSSEGLAMDVHLAVIYRPIISELYDLANEIGSGYFEEVIGPEFRSASRGVFARHVYGELMVKNEKIEDEIESEVRRRTAGKHVEIASITIEGVEFAPEITNAVRQKLVAEQDALRQKAGVEADALRKRTQIETEAEAARLRAQAETEDEKRHAELELLKQHNTRAVAEEQVAVEKAQAMANLVKAKADSEQMKILAEGQAAQNRAKSLELTPLLIQEKAYEALGALGGMGTTVYLGDWSHAPSFLFPKLGLPYSLTAPQVAPSH
ncbi:MAG TPA: SPFH domain-containing protein [Polyangiaceae bacterium]|jgi:regulator of protease activity HflC (stomatin/prohibitin superfamily)|nr:SPFH domain-containing protein [Polyangiaceae bacterium]